MKAAVPRHLETRHVRVLLVGVCVQLLQRVEDLLVTVSRTLNMELSVDQLVQHFSETKNDLELRQNRIADEGLQLVDRLNQPILIDDRSVAARYGLPYVIGQTIYIFILFLLLFFSSPNLSSRRLDVYHTSAHGVVLV